MNILAPTKAKHLYRLFSYGHGIRESARLAGVNRNTAKRYRDDWLNYRAELQRAYDTLWNGDGEGCDAITANLPELMAAAMIETWLDDQFDQPLSGWHAGFQNEEARRSGAQSDISSLTEPTTLPPERDPMARGEAVPTSAQQSNSTPLSTSKRGEP